MLNQVEMIPLYLLGQQDRDHHLFAIPIDQQPRFSVNLSVIMHLIEVACLYQQDLDSFH
jgi:hypothetical protein